VRRTRRTTEHQRIELLSGDRDSWNSDNFYMVLALEKLGQQDKAAV